MPFAAAGHEISVLFGDMSFVVIVLGVAGLALVIVEFFQPMYGIGAGSGSALIVAAVVVRMLAYGTEGMLFFMLFFVACILLVSHALMLRLHKREWLTQSVYATEEPDNEDDIYSFLLSLEGTATTRIDGYGHMSINDVNFYVTAESPIQKGERVRVVKVEGDRIVVRRADEVTLGEFAADFAPAQTPAGSETETADPDMRQ